jgi:hypothetical protein
MAAYFVAVAMLLAPRGKPWTRSSASWSNISLTWTLATCTQKARGEDRKSNWPARILSRPGHNQRRRIRACRFNSIRSQERSQKGGFLCAITAVSPSEIGVLIGTYRARTKLSSNLVCIRRAAARNQGRRKAAPIRFDLSTYELRTPYSHTIKSTWI